VAEIAIAPASQAPVRIVPDARGWKDDLFKPNDGGCMNPGNEPSDPEPPAPSTDAENFDTAVDVGLRTTARSTTRTPTPDRSDDDLSSLER
jgi:hypothetical protein